MVRRAVGEAVAQAGERAGGTGEHEEVERIPRGRRLLVGLALLREQPRQCRVRCADRFEQHPARPHQLLVDTDDAESGASRGAGGAQERELLPQVVEGETEGVTPHPGGGVGVRIRGREHVRQPAPSLRADLNDEVAGAAGGQLAEDGGGELRHLGEPMIFADEHVRCGRHGRPQHVGAGAFETSVTHDDRPAGRRQHVVQ